MGYKAAEAEFHGKAAALVRKVEQEVEHVMLWIGHDISKALHDYIYRNTPVGLRWAMEGGKLVQMPGGDLRASLHEEVVILTFEGGRWVARGATATELDYAPYVEEGTGKWGPKHAPYLIVPKQPNGTLSWINVFGHRVFAKKVLHPGSPGQHMFVFGVAKTEAEFQRLAAPALERFARTVAL